jgi:hypothetical protein
MKTGQDDNSGGRGYIACTEPEIEVRLSMTNENDDTGEDDGEDWHRIRWKYPIAEKSWYIVEGNNEGEMDSDDNSVPSHHIMEDYDDDDDDDGEDQDEMLRIRLASWNIQKQYNPTQILKLLIEGDISYISLQEPYNCGEYHNAWIKSTISMIQDYGFEATENVALDGTVITHIFETKKDTPTSHGNQTS